MSLKTFTTALILSLAPLASYAQCSGHSAVDQQAMSCADGTQWDAEAATCVPLVSA